MGEEHKQETESLDVKITKAYEEFAEPADWKQSFPWEPTAQIYYIPEEEPGSVEKMARIKGVNLWVWDAIGRKNSRGRVFTLTLKSGATKEGKPWTVVTGVVAELKGETYLRIKKPSDIPESEPGPAPAPKPLTTTPPAAAKPPVAKTPPPPEKRPDKPAPISPASTPLSSKPPSDYLKGFLARAMMDKNSDEWWRLKSILSSVGPIAGNTIEIASRMASCERSITSYPEGTTQEEARASLLEGIDHWTPIIESRTRNFEYLLYREIYAAMIAGLAITKDEVAFLMSKAVSDLSPTHYNILRETASNRVQEIQNGSAVITGTLLPETVTIEDSLSSAEGVRDGEPF